MISEKGSINDENEEKSSKKIFQLGLIGAGYFAARYFLGPEVDFEKKEIVNIWQILDKMNLVLIGLEVIGGFGWSISYCLKKIYEKSPKKTKQNLEEISKEDKELIKMNNNKGYVPKTEEYRCLKYNSRLECQTCDCFGRNSNGNVNIENCYNTKNNIANILELIYKTKKNKKPSQ